MKDSKIKNIVDKMLIGIFIILCILGFIIGICESPKVLNQIFNTTAFENASIISLIVFLILFGYIFKLYMDKKNKNKANRIKAFQGLKNIWRLEICYTDTINIGLTRDYDVSIIINDEYGIYLPLELFENLKTKEDLIALDAFCATLLKNNDVKDDENDDMDMVMKKMRIVERNFTKKIREYLKNYKTGFGK